MRKLYFLFAIWASLTLLEACDDDCPDLSAPCLTVEQLSAAPFSLDRSVVLSPGDTVARDGFAIQLSGTFTESVCAWMPELSSRLYACSPVLPYVIDEVSDVSITSPLDLGPGRPAGSELVDLFWVGNTDNNGSAALVRALNDSFSSESFAPLQGSGMRFVLAAGGLSAEVDRYAFSVAITLTDGRVFVLETVSVAVGG